MKLRVKKGVDPKRVESLFKQVSGKDETKIPQEFNPKDYPLFNEDAVITHAREIIRNSSVDNLLEDTGFDWAQRGVFELTLQDAEGSCKMLDKITTSGKPYDKRILLPFFAKKEANMGAKKPMTLPGDADARLAQVTKDMRKKVLGIASEEEKTQYEALVKAYTRLYEG